VPEILRQDGPLERSYKVTPDHLLSHKAKFSRTQALKPNNPVRVFPVKMISRDY